MDEQIIRRFLTDNAALPEQLLRALCGIPAPSHKEPPFAKSGSRISGQRASISTRQKM